MKTSNKLLCFFIAVILSSCIAELAQIAAHPGVNDPYNPYGISTSSNAPLIALGEGWAYHIGHFLADQRYGISGSKQTEQSGHPFSPGAGAHPHIDVLEGFIPSLSTDPFKWIPKGVMEDLMDNTNEIGPFPVTDGVSNFTITQLFNAIQSDVTTIPQYKAKLITQNPNTPANPNLSTQITNLFVQYGY